jgi:hypothetical protein
MVIFALAAVAGVIIAALQPPFFAPDEPWHWQTAWFRFEKLTASDSKVCNAALALPHMFHVDQIKFRYDHSLPKKVLKRNVNTKELCMPGAIQPIPYGNLLSYPGVVLARVAIQGESRSIEKAIKTFFHARFFQLSITLLILLRFLLLARQAYDRTKSWTFGTLSILMIAATPLFTQQASAVSSDGMVNALGVALATCLLFWRQVGLLDVLALLVTGVSAAFTKPIVLPVIGAVLVALVVSNGLGGGFRGKGWRESLSPIWNGFSRWQITALLVLATTSLIALFTGLNSAGTLAHHPGGAIDPAAQIQTALDSPAKALTTVFWGAMKFLSFKEFLGNLGWLDTPLSETLIGIYKRLFPVALIADFVLASWAPRRFARTPLITVLGLSTIAFVVACSALVTNALTAFALFLTWTPVGSDSVNGLQPRYFLFSYIIILASIGFFYKGLMTRLEPEKNSPGTGQDLEEAPWQQALTLIIVLISVYLFSTVSAEVAYTLARRYW